MPPLDAYVPVLAAGILLLGLAPGGSAQVIDEPPSVEIHHPPEEATVNGTLNVEGNASDRDGNVSRVEVRIDDGNWSNATGDQNWTFAWDTTQHADGEHTISARSYDGGSYSDVATRNVTVENGGNGSDGQAPSVTIDEPAESARVDGTVEIRGTALDPDGNLTQVRVRVDQAPWTEAGGTTDWSSTWDTTTATDGGHTITVEAVDEDNQTATAQRTVRVDNGGDGQSTPNQPPVVSIDRPPSETTVNGTVLVSGTASDPDGNLSDVQIRIDDGLWTPVDGIADWSVSWDTTTVEDGEHAITVQAADQEGEVTNATLNLTVANAAQETDDPPTVEIREPAPNATLNGTALIRGNASDPDGSLARVEVRIGDAAWQEVRGAASWYLRWDLSSVDPGPHTIHARAFDGEGNQASVSVPIHVEEDEQLTPTGASEMSLHLSSPEDGASVSRQLGLAGEVQGVTDPGTVIRVSYQIDEGSAGVIEVQGGGSFEETLNVSGLSSGEHELTVQAVHGEASSDAHTRTFEIQDEEEQTVGSPKIGLAMLVVVVLALGGLILWGRR